MDRRLKCIVAILSALCIGYVGADAKADIVSNIDGEIDMALYPFFDTGPVRTGNGYEEVWGTLEDQHRYTPVEFSNISTSFDGDGYYSAGGLDIFEYQYESKKPAEALLTFHAFADSLDAGDGAGGYTKLNMQITFSQAVQYRFEAAVIGVPALYEVSFNGQFANAWYSAMGLYGGTFPPVYHYDNPMPDGWDTYVDTGVLPAGTYELSIAAYSWLHRYGIGLDSEGTASLSIQLLGDANSNGHVGIEDLNRVLNHWNRTLDKRGSQQGDLNGDGIVGIEDLNMVLTGWGSNVRHTPPSPSAVPIPEPTTMMMLGIGALGLYSRRI